MNKRSLPAFIFAFLLTLAVAVTLTGCSGGDDTKKLVGTWVAESAETSDMELFSDGTGVLSNSITFTWKIENGCFIFSILSEVPADPSYSYEYKLNGSMLTLTSAIDGSVQIFNKE
ncbi:MAG: hypothetical protein FWE85_03855 [Clostridiales bacterium]|nr:hypothetical protein [Clostridiales bacterium]